ncbi:MAG: hypothetical protein OXC26_01650 [Albidovulum sp.]|nr:hypothetical protein [Albidovulum sp.]
MFAIDAPLAAGKPGRSPRRIDILLVDPKRYFYGRGSGRVDGIAEQRGVVGH